MSDNLLVLLEMIEEVLEEQSKDPEALVNIYAKQFGLDYVGFSKSTKSHIYKLPKGQFDRQVVATKINSYLLKQLPKNTKSKPLLSSGRNKEVVGLTLYNEKGRIAFRYKISGSGSGVVFAEVIESVIAVATNGLKKGTHEYKKAFNKPEKIAILDEFLPKITLSVNASGLSGLTKLEENKKLSDLYGDLGVQRGVPKTDLIDQTKKNRYSVKSGGGAQAVSAQGPESSAIWQVAAQQTIGDVTKKVEDSINKVVDEEIKKKFKYEQWSKLINNKDQKERKVFYQGLKQKLFEDLVDKLKINAGEFRKNFLIEGITGNQKFDPVKTSDGVANRLLTWNDQGTKFIIQKDIDSYVSQNPNSFRIRVSDRGGVRGGAIRVDVLSESSIKRAAQAAAIALGTTFSGGQQPELPPQQDTITQVTPQGDEQQSIKKPREVEGKMDNVVKEIKNKLGNIYKERYLVGFLDFLLMKEGDNGKLMNMAKLYELAGLEVESSDTEEPNKYIPTKGYNNRMLEET